MEYKDIVEFSGEWISELFASQVHSSHHACRRPLLAWGAMVIIIYVLEYLW